MATALLVRQQLADLPHTIGQLERAGYRVTATTAFEEAKGALLQGRHDLLVADVRLGRFNGLQLVIWKRLNGDLRPSVLLDDRRDIVIERDACRYGAAYLVESEPGLLEATVARISSKRLAQPSL